MSEETTKTMNDAVKEVRSRKTEAETESVQTTLLDQYAMSALTGLLACNNVKDAARKSFTLAQEMMEMRQKAVKGKLKD